MIRNINYAANNRDMSICNFVRRGNKNDDFVYNSVHNFVYNFCKILCKILCINFCIIPKVVTTD